MLGSAVAGRKWKGLAPGDEDEGQVGDNEGDDSSHGRLGPLDQTCGPQTEHAERHQNEQWIELRRNAEPEEDAGADGMSTTPRPHAQPGERDRGEVPVDETIEDDDRCQGEDRRIPDPLSAGEL